MNVIDQIFRQCRTIAVVGLSPKTHRDSYRVSAYMQSQGFRIIPINPNATEILGERAYASLEAAVKTETIDLVNCFRRSEDIAPICVQTLATSAQAMWLQLGVVADDCALQIQASGRGFVQNRCLMVEHRAWASSLQRK
jgi:predicted CoA-binding protein